MANGTEAPPRPRPAVDSPLNRPAVAPTTNDLFDPAVPRPPQPLALQMARLGLAVVGTVVMATGVGLWWLPAGLMAGGGVAVVVALIGEWRSAR